MRNIAAALVAVSAFASVSTSAHAAALIETYTPGGPEFRIFGDPTEGPIAGVIGVGGIVAGDFTHTFAFTLPVSGVGSGSITTSVTGRLDSAINTDFVSILVNGSALPITRTPNGRVETGSGTNIEFTAQQPNTIVVSGVSRGNGSYGGNFTFTPAQVTAAVPEPGTWAMMLFGFGALGFAMRRRRKDDVRVRYAF